ncbi:COP9 signalosome complex subunit 4-like [Hibiscus syriacus]|uniref:COP9 signalosome complex subunit 4-like n=1 Tax=Hibiscus syriacus TaxID=106335 RepID=A0A6A2WAX6_HIBSY|nr:COP9 signalosome complex subunit 4-like [Hibiscus syriacus]
MDWRKLFGCQANQELTCFPLNQNSESLIVQPPPEVFEAGMAEWKSSLVGQFLGASPNFITLQRTIEKLWNHPAQGARVQVSLAGNNLYIFSFSSDSARDWVLDNDLWHVLHKPLILRKWEPNLQRLNFDLSRLPLWVHLFNIPLELYSKEGLSYIASALGEPISMDSITASKYRLEYARVCIEIGAKDDLPESVEVMLANGSKTTIYVDIPWFPNRCRRFNTFGHSDKGCFVKSSSAPTTTKIWRIKNNQNDNTDQTPQEKSDSLHTPLSDPSLKNSLPESSSSIEQDVIKGKEHVFGNRSSLQTILSKNDSMIPTDLSNEDSKAQSYIPTPRKDSFIGNLPELLPETTPKINDSITIPKRGRGRPIKIPTKTTIRSSSNRFEILSTVDEVSPPSEIQLRKARPVAAGVAKLIKELKSKKKYHITVNGRIWIIWKQGIDLSYCFSTDQSITVKCLNNNSSFIITSIYGSNSDSHRRSLWQHLNYLESLYGSQPWILGGDFNTFLHSNESSDSHLLGPYSTTDMLDFQEVVHNLSLQDHHFFGPTFTWSNKQKNTFLARNWISMALVWTSKETQTNRPKPFKFFNFWTKHPNILEEVFSSWHIPTQDKELNVQKELTALEDNELMFLKQKAKVRWIKEGDKCSKLFHTAIASKLKRDTIRVLINNEGKRLESYDDMANEIIHYFKKQLGTSDPNVLPSDSNFLKNLLRFSLPSETATELTKIISAEEIKEALFSKGNDKAPGPDGFTPMFFKISWSVVGEDVVNTVSRRVKSNVEQDRSVILTKGRSIVDNTLLAQELVKDYDRKNISPRSADGLKLVTEKPDTPYILMDLLLDFFKGQRGIRQGDPLSPIIFVLAMNILSKILNLAAARGIFGYHPKCKKLGITHLSFADDLLIFCKGNLESIVGVSSVLSHFYSLYGLNLNVNKTDTLEFLWSLGNLLKQTVFHFLTTSKLDFTIGPPTWIQTNLELLLPSDETSYPIQERKFKRLKKVISISENPSLSEDLDFDTSDAQDVEGPESGSGSKGSFNEENELGNSQDMCVPPVEGVVGEGTSYGWNDGGLHVSYEIKGSIDPTEVHTADLVHVWCLPSTANVGPQEVPRNLEPINLLAARNERESVQIAIHPKVFWSRSSVAGIVQVQCCDLCSASGDRLIVGESLKMRRVVPILGVPDALVPLDLPISQISLQPGYDSVLIVHGDKCCLAFNRYLQHSAWARLKSISYSLNFIIVDAMEPIDGKPLDEVISDTVIEDWFGVEHGSNEWYDALEQYFKWLLQYRISPYFCRWGDSMLGLTYTSPWPADHPKSDEFFSDPRLAMLIDAQHGIHAYAPDARVLTTYYCGPSDAPLAPTPFEAFLKVPKFLRPHTQIYCTSEWIFGNREDLVKDVISELHVENGEEWWTYVCMGPSDPHPNWHLGMRGTQHRAVMWRVWKEGGTGFLYWGANCYEKATVPSAEIRFRRGLPPGDGVLYYPGEVFSSSSQPVASLRLERILSGLQYGREAAVGLLEKTGVYLGPERYSMEQLI